MSELKYCFLDEYDLFTFFLFIKRIVNEDDERDKQNPFNYSYIWKS